MIEPLNQSHTVSSTGSLVDRDLISLNRLGYYHVQAEDMGNGKIRLTGTIPSHDDRAIVVAMARTVAGVTAVAIKLKV